MWFLSPSGWPTHADSDDERWDLEDRGYAPIDEADVPAAVAAYQAGQPAPATQDPLSSSELVTAIQTPSDPVAVALRAALGSHITSPFAAFMAGLADGAQSQAWINLGDSTGDEPEEWVYLTMQALAARYPALTVDYVHWNGAAMDATQRVQTGAAGERYVTIKADVNGFQSLLNPGQSKVSGDLEVEWRGQLDNWASGAGQTLIALFGAAGARAWRLYISNSGKLNVDLSGDGTALKTFTSTANPITAAAPVWLKASCDIDNGAAGVTVTFSQSDDGVTWTSVGTPVTVAGALASIFAAPVNYEIGARQDSVDPAYGQHYAVRVRDGIGGPTVTPRRADVWMPQNRDAYALGGAPVLTVVNGSQSGAGITYLTDPTRYRQMSPDYGTTLVTLSCSHNDLTQRGPVYLAQWDTWLSSLRNRFPVATVALIGQNPKRADVRYAEDHRIRHGELLGWARRNDVPTIDVWRKFVADSRGLAVLLKADGIHPDVTTGTPLWRDTVLASLYASGA